MSDILFGIDEVGRGCVYGSLCVAAVSTAGHPRVPGVKDSKKLSDKRRRDLAPRIKDQSVWTIGLLPADCINQHGIEVCLEQLVYALMGECTQKAVALGYDHINFVVDGDDISNKTETVGDVTVDVRAQAKADQTVYEVGAASIIAKVHRDDLVIQEVHDDPSLEKYHLQTNKGYGTPQHAAALIEYGMAPGHRKQFCKSLMRTHAAKRRDHLTMSEALLKAING